MSVHVTGGGKFSRCDGPRAQTQGQLKVRTTPNSNDIPRPDHQKNTVVSGSSRGRTFFGCQAEYGAARGSVEKADTEPRTERLRIALGREVQGGHMQCPKIV